MQTGLTSHPLLPAKGYNKTCPQEQFRAYFLYVAQTYTILHLLLSHQGLHSHCFFLSYSPIQIATRFQILLSWSKSIILFHFFTDQTVPFSDHCSTKSSYFQLHLQFIFLSNKVISPGAQGKSYQCPVQQSLCSSTRSLKPFVIMFAFYIALSLLPLPNIEQLAHSFLFICSHWQNSIIYQNFIKNCITSHAAIFISHQLFLIPAHKITWIFLNSTLVFFWVTAPSNLPTNLTPKDTKLNTQGYQNMSQEQQPAVVWTELEW